MIVPPTSADVVRWIVPLGPPYVSCVVNVRGIVKDPNDCSLELEEDELEPFFEEEVWYDTESVVFVPEVPAGPSTRHSTVNGCLECTSPGRLTNEIRRGVGRRGAGAGVARSAERNVDIPLTLGIGVGRAGGAVGKGLRLVGGGLADGEGDGEGAGDGVASGDGVAWDCPRSSATLPR
jgi:hypothetical protein